MFIVMYMKVEIVRLNDQGIGIGLINNKVIFIPNTVIGDIVDVEIIKENKKYYEGKVKKYLKYSDKRVDFKCKYKDKCGGCQICNLKYDEQLKFKKNKVEYILKKFCNINIFIDIIGTDDIINYRNKVTLHVKNNKLGYYEEKSNKLIEINSCLLLDNNINKVIKILKNINLNNVNEIVIRTNDDKVLVNFKGNDIKINIDKLNNIDIIYINDKLIKEDNLYQTINNYKFKISSDAFFQVNINQMKKLYDIVREYVSNYKDLNVLDLFCGTGTIGIYVSDLCKSVKGIEINNNAIKDAKINKDINYVNNIEFICDDVFNVKDMDSDLVIVDPPRSGLNKEIINLFIKSKIRNIIYVSCNPITFARDINLLKNDYNINDIKAVDMFPNTYHVECVCLLEIKERKEI